MTTKTIVVPNVDINLLRRQRDWLLNDIMRDPTFNELPKPELIDGILNLLDEMLDIAEGYK